MSNKVLVAFRIEKDVWDKFYSKYRKNSHQKLRELILEDLNK